MTGFDAPGAAIRHRLRHYTPDPATIYLLALGGNACCVGHGEYSTIGVFQYGAPVQQISACGFLGEFTGIT